MIPYGRQTIDDDDIRAVVQVLRSDWLTQGPQVDEFENALTAAGGSRYAVVFCNGSAALQAAYSAAGLTEGDEIVTSPITFVATANAAVWLGAKPVFADVQLHTGNMDPSAAEKAITPRTKVLAPIDYAGHPAEWDALLDIAKRHQLIVVEDACHALGARYKGRQVGSFSDMTVFSFHPVKSITTGEGGAVLTNNQYFYERLLRFRHHGITKTHLSRPSPGDWYYEVQELALNGRLTDLQCALGLSQLRKLNDFIARRQDIAAGYSAALKEMRDVRMVAPRHQDESSWHLFPILLEGPLARQRDEIFTRLRRAGIGVQVHYVPVHRHPYYQALGYRAGLCPQAEDFSCREISLPIFPRLTIEEQDQVIRTLQTVVADLYEGSHSR